MAIRNRQGNSARFGSSYGLTTEFPELIPVFRFMCEERLVVERCMRMYENEKYEN